MIDLEAIREASTGFVKVFNRYERETGKPAVEDFAAFETWARANVDAFSAIDRAHWPTWLLVAERDEARRRAVPRRPRLTQTHTFVELAVSRAAYDEIAGLLREAGYGHVFVAGDDGEGAIDMHGIALVREEEAPLPRNDCKPYFGPDGKMHHDATCQEVPNDPRHVQDGPAAEDSDEDEGDGAMPAQASPEQVCGGCARWDDECVCPEGPT